MPDIFEMLNDPWLKRLSPDKQARELAAVGVPVDDELRRFLQQRHTAALPSVAPSQGDSPDDFAPGSLARVLAPLLATGATMGALPGPVGMIAGPLIGAGVKYLMEPQLSAEQSAFLGGRQVLSGIAGAGASMLPGGTISGPLVGSAVDYMLDPRMTAGQGAAGAMMNIGGNLLDSALRLPGMNHAIGRLLTSGVKQGAGALGGLSLADLFGFVDPQTSDYVMAGAAPLALGGGAALTTAGGRFLGHGLPGGGIARGEAGMEESQAFIQQALAAETAKASQAYAALDKISGQGQVTNQNVLALRKEVAAQTLDPNVPGLYSGKLRSMLGVGTLTKAEATLPKIALRRDRESVIADTLELALQQQAVAASQRGTPPMTPLQLKQWDLLRRRYTNATNTVQQTEDAIVAVREQIMRLGTEQPTTFAESMDMFQKLNHVLNGVNRSEDGRFYGEVMKIRNAGLKDVDEAIQSGTLPQAMKDEYQTANNAFKKKVAFEDIVRMTTQAGDSKGGVIVINGEQLHKQLWQDFQDPEGLPARAFTKQEREGLLEVYAALARQTMPDNQIGIAVGFGGLGAMAGSLFGEGGTPASAGAVVAMGVPGLITRIAVANPLVRRSFLALVRAGEGQIPYQTLLALSQMAEREIARELHVGEEVEVEVAPPSAR